VKPLVLQSPLKSSGQNDWWWGNAPDHTGFDTHAWSGERYCYDIVMHDAVGSTFAGDCTQNPDGSHSGACTINSSFYAYGHPVLASVKGDTLVKDIYTGPENFGYNGNPKTDTNMVVTQQADKSVVGYFHLQPVPPVPADPLTKGAQVGALGNSGNSSEPHLHLGAVVLHATGRGVISPLTFTNLKTIGGTPVTDVPGNGLYKT